MELAPVLINGQWRQSSSSSTFQPVNPATKEKLPVAYPVSDWDEIAEALEAARAAVIAMRGQGPEKIAAFLEKYADELEARRAALVEIANLESALPKEPRLNSVEFPRTTNQLRQAAAAARERSWAHPTIDTKNNIRSMFAPMGGAVVVFGPNNFPFAFNSIAGGDFAAAIAAGNPVIAKANTSHPGTTRLLAEAALAALEASGLPPGFVQLLYRTSQEDGLKLVAHPLTAATGFTGSRNAGLRLKAAADAANKPIYLEMSSINPLFVLPGVLDERLEVVAGEFAASCLLGAGQFCTNPGFVALVGDAKGEEFLRVAAEKMSAANPGVLLGAGGPKAIADAIATLKEHGAEVVIGGLDHNGAGYSFQNTLLRVSGDGFIAHPEALQTEAFGSVSLFVLARDADQLIEVANALEGNLTGTIYSDTRGSDDALYARLEPALREKVGRLLNDKMPTGVAVSPAMVHGGPPPSTGHPGFTAVGIPASLVRFAALQSYDNVRPDRLPAELRDANPTDGKTWRLIDGQWSRDDVKRD